MAQKNRKHMRIQIRSKRTGVETATAPLERSVNRPLAPFSMQPWDVNVDVFEQEGKVIVRADVPGVKPEDVDVSLEGNNLVITGLKEERQEIDKKGYYYSERSSGQFYRSIPLPKGVLGDSHNANYKNGVLEVTLRRLSPGQVKKAKVRTSH